MSKKYCRLLEKLFLMCYDRYIMEVNNERDFNNSTGSGVFASM